MSSVKLIAKTVSVIDGLNTAEDLISYAARVSNPGNQLNTDTSSKLLSYMLNKKHFSPFEMVDLTFEIRTTRDIGRQILRHKSFSFQEFSQRYAVVKTSYFQLREARLQDIKNRQASLDTDDQELAEGWKVWQEKVAQTASHAYEWAIDNGIAKEQARVVLPEGMTPSVMYMKGNLRNWIHYVEVRSGDDTQKEHRLIALEIKELLKTEFQFLREFWN
tara:strand:- start:5748 stop:6401 length:654 start_codon:yes stop_codon:yes gene_type:complete